MEPYSTEIERTMQQFYTTLSEKDKRRYAAVEARKLGRGGITYVAKLLHCDRKTIRAGLTDLTHLSEEDELAGRVRRAGGGRKPYHVTYPEIDQQFLTVLQEYTAGDPMHEEVLWTDLTGREIATHLAEQYHVTVSETVIRQLLQKHHYRRRKAQKNGP